MTVPDRPSGVAYLLSQVGAHVSARFAERLTPVGLTPPDAAVLRTLGRLPQPADQRTLAIELALTPSRVVALVDSLAQRGLVERRTNATDRRRNDIVLTGDGRAALATLRRVASEHDAEIVAGLGHDEVGMLRALLERVRDSADLTPGRHPGA